MRCPGSIRASEGLPNVSSVFAEEGTMLHEVAANLLSGLPVTHELTEEQEAVVFAFVDTVMADFEPGDTILVEAKFKLPHHPEFWGTADVVIAKPAMQRLKVYDLKCGRGVNVEADYGGRVNPQLGFYALGALSMFKDQRFEDIEMVIVQPRLGGVKRRATTMQELDALAAELVAAAATAEQPDAPRAAGSHCKFCLARKTCSELMSETLRLAQMDFDDTQPIHPAVLSQPDLGEVLDKADVIETWLKAVREHAMQQVEAGIAVPGWKLVEKRSVRKWKDIRMVKQRLLSEGLTGFESEDIASPAQVEKLAKKQGVQLDLFDLIEANSRGVTLVRETDKRAAAGASAADDFAD
ncbi:Protein of unknown function DUF2800 [uncultured Caudovirales phage]|uniref:DUF2800 domain-containing protein n=1 Tax=uncultured Caudovirales phage TaxID=2100421 RepID=A0A6J5KQM6_9CAUD|nr:Protein of unknown function DUF2800 [uncultured Caudovirales phage]